MPSKKYKNSKGELVKYVYFDKNKNVTDFYELNNNVLTKSNKIDFANKKSKILFDECCELNCMNLGDTNRIIVIKKGDVRLTPAKIKSRIDLNEEAGTFSFTVKQELLYEWIKLVN